MRRTILVLALAISGCNCDDPGLTGLVGVLEAAPTRLDFGEVEVFEQKTLSFTLTNVGDRGVLADRLFLDGASLSFTFDPTPRAVRVGASAVVEVTFMPQSAGPHAAVLVVESDADEGGELRIELAGVGVDPCVDADGDGFGESCRPGADCDDTAATVYPGAPEACDAVDQDCDAATDEGYVVGAPCTASFQRPDGTSCTLEGLSRCSADGTDVVCDLFDAVDVCDGVDNDCNGTVDDPFPGVGDTCYVPDGACQREGVLECSPDGATAECVPDPGAPADCCPAGTSQNAEGVCCTPLPTGACAHTCTVDLVAGTHDCVAPIAVTSLASGMGLLTLDLAGLTGAEVRVEVCDATGHWFDLADSSTCNGGGGDGSTSSNDAEVHAQDAGMWLFGNDYSPASGRILGSAPGFGGPGCVTRTVWVADQRAQVFDPCLDVSSPFALRLDPPRDDEGVPDALWYLGLNRVASDTSRSGTGVRSATVCLR